MLHMIPQFPALKNLTIEDKEEVESLTKGFLPYSDYNFFSLYTYNTEDDFLVTNLNNNLVVRFRDYLTQEYHYSFIGRNDLLATTATLLKDAESRNYQRSLQLIGEEIINEMPQLSDKFHVAEDYDNHDYILSVDELTTLAGKKYYDKRNLLNRFHRWYPDHQVQLLDLTDKPTRKQLFELFKRWAAVGNHPEEEVAVEKKAFTRMFDVIDEVKPITLGVFVESTLVSFSVSDILNNEYATIAFEKGNVTYAGVYAKIVNETAKLLQERGITYINYEQDMGIQRMKQA